MLKEQIKYSILILLLSNLSGWDLVWAQDQVRLNQALHYTVTNPTPQPSPPITTITSPTPPSWRPGTPLNAAPAPVPVSPTVFQAILRRLLLKVLHNLRIGLKTAMLLATPPPAFREECRVNKSLEEESVLITCPCPVIRQYIPPLSYNQSQRLC